MQSEWEERELDDFLEKITYGFTNPMPDADQGPWKITAKDVNHGRINYSTARKTSAEAFEHDLTDKSRPILGDVLLTKDGSIGRVAIVDKKGICINQSVALLRPNKKITPQFLKYLLLSPYYQKVMANDVGGTTIKHIYITRVNKMMVRVPLLSTQNKITNILSTLDDKIELNRKMNQTLEDMAQSLFKSWFVDFDPMHAKADAKSDAEMDAVAAELGIAKEVLELFPSEFVESEMGMIPKGWEVKGLGEVAKFQQGKQIELEKQFSVLENDLLRFVRIIDYTNDSEPPRYIKADKSLASYVTENDVVMIRYGSQTAGKVVMGKSGIIANNMFRVIPILDNVPNIYLFYFLQSDNVYSYLRGGQSSSTMPAITFGLMKSMNLVLPNKAVLLNFRQLVSSLLFKKQQNLSEISTLQETRDALLPKLLSGELDVSEAME